MLTEKTFETGELSLNYAEGSTVGQAMVLLHGLSGHWQAWDTLLPELEAKWHLYALDLRGHGKSGRGAQYRIIDYARDVIAFVRSLDEPVVLIGHSTGALTALAAAAGYSAGLRAIVSIDPPLFLRNASITLTPHFHQGFTWMKDTLQDSPSYETLLLRCRTMLPPETSETEVAVWADQISRVAIGAIENALRDEHLAGLDLAYTLQSITCPTLLLQGDWANGGAMRHEDADFVRANLPSAKLRFIPNGGHMGLGEQTETILQHINAFLASL